jgi:hypothetical protein
LDLESTNLTEFFFLERYVIREAEKMISQVLGPKNPVAKSGILTQNVEKSQKPVVNLQYGL